MHFNINIIKRRNIANHDLITFSKKINSPYRSIIYLFIGNLYLQLMEINKPDKGLFRGIGALEREQFNNKKYFPRLRNIHQFEYTHAHSNNYVTSFQRFFTTVKNTPPTTKPKTNTNQSTFQIGTDPNNYCNSLSKTDYKAFERVHPPKLIKPKEEGIMLGEQKTSDHYMTTAMEKYGNIHSKQPIKVNFKNRGASRFNPITGQTRTLSFGYEDFSMGRNNNYKATNFTVLPQKDFSVDIISGRKLTYK